MDNLVVNKALKVVIEQTINKELENENKILKNRMNKYENYLLNIRPPFLHRESDHRYIYCDICDDVPYGLLANYCHNCGSKHCSECSTECECCCYSYCNKYCKPVDFCHKCTFLACDNCINKYDCGHIYCAICLNPEKPRYSVDDLLKCLTIYNCPSCNATFCNNCKHDCSTKNNKKIIKK